MDRCPTCKRALPKPLPRKGPMRDPAYRRWLHDKRCVVYEYAPLHTFDYCSCGNVIDAAHTQNNGMRSKGPDSSCVPLCRKHHTEYDAGRAAFERKYQVNMKQLAAEHYERFLEEQAKP